MNVEDEAIQTLMGLGLTSCQAKVYLVLVQNGSCTAKTISHISKVSRQDVYRIMPQLQKLGFVQQLVGIPNEWKAIPADDGLAILMKRKKEQISELQEKSTNLLNNLRENNKTTLLEKGRQFVILPGKDAHMKWLKNKIEKSQKTNDAIISWEDYKIVSFFCDKEIEKIVDRDTKIRLIIYVSENEKTLYKSDQTYKNKPNFQKLFIFTPPLIFGAIFDSKEVVIAPTLNNPIQRGEKILWSNNLRMISLFQNYFERLWKTAIENKHSRTIQ